MRTARLANVSGFFELWPGSPTIQYRFVVYAIGFQDGKYGLPACESYDFYLN